jgi:hypothetical protein
MKQNHFASVNREKNPGDTILDIGSNFPKVLLQFSNMLPTDAFYSEIEIFPSFPR